LQEVFLLRGAKVIGKMENGKWGVGIGDWGLGIGERGAVIGEWDFFSSLLALDSWLLILDSRIWISLLSLPTF